MITGLSRGENEKCYRFPMKKIVITLAVLLALSFIAMAITFLILFHHK